MKPGWHATLRMHAEAAAAFADSAESLPDRAWATPIAAGKWTPAEITAHLIQAYDVLSGELEGGPGMRIRTRRWQRLLLRIALVPLLLRGSPFPTGARAPRETRPAETITEGRDELLGRFRDEARRFESAARRARNDPTSSRRLTHAYFGSSGLRDGILLCTRHIQHHHRQIAGAVSPFAP